MNDVAVGSLPEVTPAVWAPATCRVSVLMSILGGDTNITYVTAALESICAQSILPDQLVLVIDNPLADELETVIARHMSLFEIASVEIVRVPNTRGIAAAFNGGIARCNGDWIMCANGDSVCHQERLAIQLDYMARHPEIDAWFSWCEEFADGAKRTKVSAIHHEAIVSALRWRNVLVYSSALIRSSVLRQSAGTAATRSVSMICSCVWRWRAPVSESSQQNWSASPRLRAAGCGMHGRKLASGSPVGVQVSSVSACSW